MENIKRHLAKPIRLEHEKINELEPADMYDLMAIQDFLDSNNIVSAQEKMEKIPPEKRDHPSVLYIAYQIHATLHEWNKATHNADSLFRQIPDCPEAWVILAETASHKPDGSLLEAKDILIKAEAKFPGNFLISLKLAGCCVQLLQFDEADRWIKQSMAIDHERVRQIAGNDENLMQLSSVRAVSTKHSGV